MPKIGSVILVHDETESVLEARSFPSPAGRCSSRAQRALRCVVGGTDVPTSATLALDEPTASWLALGSSPQLARMPPQAWGGGLVRGGYGARRPGEANGST